MTRTRSIALQAGALGSAALIALAGCSSSDDSNGDGGEAVTVAIAGEEPYSYLDENGEATGASVALAERGVRVPIREG